MLPCGSADYSGVGFILLQPRFVECKSNMATLGDTEITHDFAFLNGKTHDINDWLRLEEDGFRGIL